jgi:hypothetical protein
MRHGLSAFAGMVLLMSATAHARPDSQIIWWRTTGAIVKEYDDARKGTVCSLFLSGPHATLAFTWTRSNAEDIAFYKNDWWFQPDQQLAVAVKIGAFWLHGPLGGTPPSLMAETRRDHLSVTTDQPMQPLLQKARSVTVKLADREASVEVDTRKMRKLLKAVRRCRSVLNTGSD